MNTKHLELIYQYMGWCSHSNGDIIWGLSGCHCALCGNLMLPNLLDSNACWECVQEISKKGEWWGFHDYAIKNMPEGITYQHEETRWFMEADNFFNCMGSWLEERNDEQIVEAVSDFKDEILDQMAEDITQIKKVCEHLNMRGVIRPNTTADIFTKREWEK